MNNRVIILLVILAAVYFMTFRGCLNPNVPNNQERFENEVISLPKKKIKCTLYTSSTCPHCLNMLPEWDKFKKDIQHNGNISVVHKKDKEIDDANVQYVPMLKITIEKCNCDDDNNNNKEHYYQGAMTAGAIRNYIETL
jgi:hypothetical protein